MNTGNNAGFLFPISGAVQNDQTVSNFGGIICSASNATMRIWTPVSTGPGYLLYINQDWGNSMYPQSSKKATLIVQIWQSSTCNLLIYCLNLVNVNFLDRLLDINS